jgi:hypothetical protein
MVTSKDVPPEFWHHYPGMTQCAACDRLVRRTEAIVVTRHITEVTTDTEVFCSHECAENWAEIFHAEE